MLDIAKTNQVWANLNDADHVKTRPFNKRFFHQTWAAGRLSDNNTVETYLKVTDDVVCKYNVSLVKHHNFMSIGAISTTFG